MSAVFTMQQRGWDAYAGKLGVELMQNTQKFLDWLCGQVEGEFILDADCGQAAILMLLAREGKNVVGLSSDAAILGQARAFIADEPSQVQRNITLHNGSLLDVNALIDRSFDTILLPQSIALTTQPEDSIEVAFRKLKPGGRLISLWPFGALSPSGSGYYLREPANLLARHFETTLVRLFGDTMAIICKPRAKVLERLPTIAAWPDDVIQEAESALTASQVASKAQLNTTQGELREMKRELARASTELETLSQLQAQHESQATTLKAQLEAIQHAERDAVASAQEELARLKEQLKESQAAAESAKHAASQVQAQSRILELEKAQEIAVLRHEKLQRDVTIQDARREAEHHAAQAQLQIQEAGDALRTAHAARDDALQRLHAAETAAKSTSAMLERRVDELRSALAGKQQDIDDSQQRIDELTALTLERAQAIEVLQADHAHWTQQHERALEEKQKSEVRLESELEGLRHDHDRMRAAKQHADARIQTLEKNVADATTAREGSEQERSKLQFSLNTLTTQLFQARTAQRDAQSAAISKIQDIQTRLTLAENQVAEFEGRLKDAQLKARGIVAQFRETQKNEKEATEKIRHLERRLRNLQLEKEQALQQVEQTRKTLSFQLGYALLHGFKSWSAFFSLPSEFVRIHKEGKIRRERKRLKQTAVGQKTVKTNAVHQSPVTKVHADPIMLAGISAQNKKMRVAGIMDEFTYHSYAPECELLQLRPETWQMEVEEFKPDLVFIESAWKGVEDLWQRKISNCADEVRALLAWAKKNNVPTLFWNKEDPVHFSTFIELASLVDHVFTTDIDCIPKYKKILGHGRVYLLPFAAQPAAHNPIEIHERKDAFNFAGSYYLRYPERQRDFAALVDTVKKFRPIEIYDRNYEKPHPHYQFPEKYTPYILGNLKFDEIDRAYKGYRYGINMNTIKQSQTMFARRVFELLASNTVVVSNFSRGTRLLFGDLVIASDEATQIESRISTLYADELAYRKFRLAGLRKVMAEHTYRHRLSYIKAKLSSTAYSQQIPAVLFVALADSSQSLTSIQNSFLRQSHGKCRLCVLTTGATSVTSHDPRISYFSSVDSLTAAVRDFAPQFELIGTLHPRDYYGTHYAEDLAWASTYGSSATAFGKVARYTYQTGELALLDDGKQYRPAAAMRLRCSVLRIKEVTDADITRWLDTQDTASSEGHQGLAIDEFNYCVEGAAADAKTLLTTQDAVLVNKGVSFDRDLAPLAEAIKPATAISDNSDDDLPSISGAELAKRLRAPASKMITLAVEGDTLSVRSKLPQESFAYVYVKESSRRAELNMELNSQFTLVCDDPGEVRTVFEFQDKDRKKLSHSIVGAEGTHALAIPNECVYIRFGLRIQGNCNLKIHKLVLGSHGQKPSIMIGRSNTLVLSKQYPAYDDLYKYGFLHTRVRAYARAGHAVDVFRISAHPGQPYREFENIDVANGNAALLRQSLESGRYSNVLVHILDKSMWDVLKDFLDKINITVWAHGSEIQVWQRRAYEFADLSPDEIARKKKLSDNRRKFWRDVFSNTSPNLRFVFVSEWLKRTTEEDMDVSLTADRYMVIPNHVDGAIFDYKVKQAGDRTKLLSIRPYANRTYANDLTVQTILNLSKKPYFQNLSIELCGDGELFDETTAPLANFPNVKLTKGFLTHAEISAKHKSYGVFLTPSRMDTQGVSRDEAMSSGLVPITTNTAAISEFLSKEEGFLCPPEDATALSAAVEHLFQNPEDFLKKSEAANKRVAYTLAVDKTITRELNLFTR
jgi:spore maturation protein CgeB/glycosyltransferase involved in cell wall biosynthesis/SAM-dependent methyltransferase